MTINQAKVLNALITFGTSDAKTISSTSGIGREETYRILPRLQELGLVGEQMIYPKSFKAPPLEETLNILIERKKTETANLEEISQKVIQIFNNTKQKTPENDYQLILVPPKQISQHKAAETWQKVRKKVWLISNWELVLDYLHIYREGIIMALKRGIELRILSEKTENILEQIRDFREFPSFRIRFLAEPPKVTFVIRDSKIVAISTSDNSQVRFMESPSLLSSLPPFIELAENYFQAKWNTATKYENHELESRQRKTKSLANAI
jgi:sugar-specific transcriptional regulator TrmB